MTIIDCRPFLAVGVYFLAAILIAFSRKNPNLRETWSVIASVLSLVSFCPWYLLYWKEIIMNGHYVR